MLASFALDGPPKKRRERRKEAATMTITDCLSTLNGLRPELSSLFSLSLISCQKLWMDGNERTVFFSLPDPAQGG